MGHIPGSAVNVAPDDLKKLSLEELRAYCDELRGYIIQQSAYPHLTVERVGLDDIMVFINRAEKEREAEA